MNYEPTRVLYTGLREPEPIEGITILHLPALQFRTLAYPIADVVIAIENCDAVTVYSSRAIDAIRKEPRILRALLDVKPTVIVVGERTSKAWEENIDPRCDPFVCATFSKVVKTVQELQSERIVALELQDGPRSLANAEIESHVDAFEVYATSRSTPDQKTWSKVETFEPEWVAFTSPRGVRAFTDRIRTLKLPLRYASIGPTTTAAAKSAGFDIRAEASQASAESLLRAIMREST